MTATWPVGIPTSALINDSNYNESGETNVAETKPQVGPPQRRRRSSSPTTLVTFTTLMTFAQYDQLTSFYLNTLLDGTDFFTRPHPRTGASVTCTFEQYPASGQPVSGTQYQVQMQLRLYQ